MSNFMGLIFAIILGILVTVLSLVLIGKGYSDYKLKTEVTSKLNQVREIQVAISAYNAEKSALKLGNFNPEENVNGLNVFQPIIDSGFLKPIINEDIVDFRWFFNRNILNIQQKLGDDENSLEKCKMLNFRNNGTDLELEPPTCESNPDNLICCVSI